MINEQRAKVEEQVLAYYLPSNIFRFCDIGTSSPYLKVAVKDSGDAVYFLYFDLARFPESPPKVYVQQMLHTHSGEPMNSVSDENYTLAARNGWTQLLHYEDDSWSCDVSLWKVYLICLLWIEMYRAHLHTGKSMYHYLDYQDSSINLDKAFQCGKQLFNPNHQHSLVDTDARENSIPAPNNPS